MKLLIFDIDGTLTNTTKVDDKCFIKAFEQTFSISIEGYDWDTLQNVTDWGITEEIILNKFGRVPTAFEYEEMMANFVAQLEQEKIKNKNQFEEVKGATAYFNYLKTQSNCQLGIATGGWRKSALLKLNTIGIDVSGVAFATSNDYKSRVDITRFAIQQLKDKVTENIDETIYFGDGLWDYKTCKNLGIRFVGIDVLGNGKLKEAGAEEVFRDFVSCSIN